MNASPSRRLLLAMALSFALAPRLASGAKAHDAAPVTEANLLASERFWPYHVALVEAWSPPDGARALRAGTSGVLIRVERSGAARIDFGRDGRFEVPVARTDLVARANRIRTGSDEKSIPNFLMALGPRLVDPSADSLAAYPLERALGQRAFLTVLADPGTPEFPALLASIAPLRARSGLLTILLPEGAHPDATVREQLRAAECTAPFVYDHLAEPYAQSLLPAGIALPALLLQTPEGRLLYAAPWTQRSDPQLAAALDAALGATTPRKKERKR